MAEKKKVEVTIEMRTLVDDIQNETYLRYRTVQNDQNFEEAAHIAASEDEENMDKILRSIKRGFSDIKMALAEYLDENGLSTNNRPIDGETDLVLKLTMPSNFNEAATAGVAESVHAYLLNASVADWYTLTNKGDAADYIAMAQRSMENIKRAVSKRSRPKRTSQIETSDPTE